MDTWKALFNLDGQKQIVKRAQGPSFGLAGPVNHVYRCSCRAVSEIDEWHGESSSFFQANNPQSIAGELYAPGNIAVVVGGRTLQCCEVSTHA